MDNGSNKIHSVDDNRSSSSRHWKTQYILTKTKPNSSIAQLIYHSGMKPNESMNQTLPKQFKIGSHSKISIHQKIISKRRIWKIQNDDIFFFTFFHCHFHFHFHLFLFHPSNHQSPITNNDNKRHQQQETPTLPILYFKTH